MVWVLFAACLATPDVPARRTRLRPSLLQNRALQTPYVQTISLANVTEPTAIPPPPPTLNPVTDYQPLDTALGDFIQKQFLEPPTVTPPPTQAALDLYNSCPVINGGNIPGRLFVQAPSGCGAGGRNGEWLDDSGNVLLKWQETDYSATGTSVTFRAPTGDSFGSATQEMSMHGVAINMYDCGLNLRYTLTEKALYAPGRVDQRLCQNPKYKICHGSIYLKYEIYEKGDLRATSALVPLFADKWTLNDAVSGGPVVTLTRAPDNWTPRDECQTDRRKREWVMTMGAGYLSDANRWHALGYMMTVLAMRDEERTNEGLLRLTATETKTSLVAAVLFVGSVVILAVLWSFFTSFVRKPLTRTCIQLEDSLFPMAMYKNSYYY